MRIRTARHEPFARLALRQPREHCGFGRIQSLPEHSIPRNRAMVKLRRHVRARGPLPRPRIVPVGVPLKRPVERESQNVRFDRRPSSEHDRGGELRRSRHSPIVLVPELQAENRRRAPREPQLDI